MADLRITELAALTTVLGEDLLAIVDDPTGTASTKKIRVDNFQASGGGWINAADMTYASADDPTFTATMSGDVSGIYGAGMRIKLTQPTGGTKYFIITKIAVSGDTTLTLYGGTDYNLENETITAPYYSFVKCPHGFPLSPVVWTAEATDTTQRLQATPTQNTWYNLGSFSLSIPIGAWKVCYMVTSHCNDTTAANYVIQSTLSTANNSASDADLTTSVFGGSFVNLAQRFYTEKYLSLSSKTAYYLNTRTTSASVDNLVSRNDEAKAIIRAVCAYL